MIDYYNGVVIPSYVGEISLGPRLMQNFDSRNNIRIDDLIYLNKIS